MNCAVVFLVCSGPGLSLVPTAQYKARPWGGYQVWVKPDSTLTVHNTHPPSYKHKIKTVFVFFVFVYTQPHLCWLCTVFHVIYIMRSVTKLNQTWPHQSLISHHGKTRNRIHMPLHATPLWPLPLFAHCLLELEKFVRRVCELDQQDASKFSNVLVTLHINVANIATMVCFFDFCLFQI